MRCCAFIWIVFYTGIALLSPVSATVLYTDITSDTLTVGDRLELTVAIVTAKGAQVTPPDIEGGIGEFTVKDWMTDRRERDNSDSVTFKYLITTYSLETCSIPGLPYIVTSAGGSDTLPSRTIPVRVVSVIPAGTDTVELKDIKPQQSAGTPSFLWLWIVLAAAAAAAGAWFLRRWIDKRRKPAPLPPPPPPYEEAVAALAELDRLGLPAQGRVREYVFRLSDIFKRYIGRRFGANAADFTTSEMLAWIRFSALDKEQKNGVDWFFRTSDPVKFAKWVPDGDTTGRFGAEVRAFLEATRPSVEQEKKPENTAEVKADAPAQS